MTYKNSQKRYYDSSYVYFITVNTKNKQSFFREKIWCDLWIEELKILKELKPFKLFGFCLNYDHFHMLLRCDEKNNISQIIKFFKENFSRDANKIIRQTIVSATAPSRLQMNNIVKILQKRFYKKFIKKNNHPVFLKFSWQKSFYDHVIRNEKDLEEHYNYCVYNFQKHDLPENWRYTSLNYPELIDSF